MKAAGALIGLPRELRTRDNMPAIYGFDAHKNRDRRRAVPSAGKTGVEVG
jgi:hypothetical protein